MIKRDVSTIDVVSEVVEDINCLLNTGRCPLSRVTCCADCPADADPEDVTACYVYMLEYIRNKLKSLL